MERFTGKSLKVNWYFSKWLFNCKGPGSIISPWLPDFFWYIPISKRNWTESIIWICRLRLIRRCPLHQAILGFIAPGFGFALRPRDFVRLLREETTVFSRTQFLGQYGLLSGQAGFYHFTSILFPIQVPIQRRLLLRKPIRGGPKPRNGSQIYGCPDWWAQLFFSTRPRVLGLPWGVFFPWPVGHCGIPSFFGLGPQGLRGPMGFSSSWAWPNLWKFPRDFRGIFTGGAHFRGTRLGDVCHTFLSPATPMSYETAPILRTRIGGWGRRNTNTQLDHSTNKEGDDNNGGEILKKKNYRPKRGRSKRESKHRAQLW